MDEAIWTLRQLLEASRPIIDELVDNLVAQCDASGIERRLARLPTAAVARAVGAAARRILALPAEAGVSPPQLLADVRTRLAAWAERTARHLPPHGVDNLARGRRKFTGSDEEVLSTMLQGHAVCETLAVSLPMPNLLKGHELLRIDGLGDKVAEVLQWQTRLVQQTAPAGLYDALMANAAPVAVTLSQFDECVQAR